MLSTPDVIYLYYKNQSIYHKKMKLQKTFLLFPLLALCLLLPQYSYAVALNQSADGAITKEVTEAPPTESPVCNLEANILAIEKNPANGDYYDVSIEVNSVNISRASEPSACDANYGEQIRKSGLTLKTSEYLKQVVQKGDIIRAKVRFTGDGTLTGYFLSDIQITGQVDDKGQTATAAKAASTEKVIGAVSILTIMVLAGMIYSSRKRTTNS